MKIKGIKCKCGREELFFTTHKKHIGIYCCSYCGKFVKWANKDEVDLMKKHNKCEGCLYDNMVVIPPYMCLQCSRFYADKYTTESGD